MRVIINARIPSGVAGGVEQIVIGLASGLAQVARPGEEYLFLTSRGEDAWLRPYLRGPCRIVYGRAGILRHVARLARRVPGWKRMRDVLVRRRKRLGARSLPISDGTAERLGADVVHFPYQGAFLTTIPSIYHPWDLQHVHHPEFFADAERLTRDLWYRAFCSQASIVSVATQWGKQDLVAHLGVPAEKIEVVPVAPVLTAYEEPSVSDLNRFRTRLGLPETFAFFPARTWPHKNHLAIVEALAVLRSRGSVRHVVFSGEETPHANEIRAEAARLGVGDQVHFIGFVSPLEVQCIYRLATCLVFPSRFEGWGLPVTEAFLAGLPVAASNASCLPETTAGAALLFAPDDIGAIADAIEALMTDARLRADLVARGRAVVRSLTWIAAAERFRELYLSVATGPRAGERVCRSEHQCVEG